MAGPYYIKTSPGGELTGSLTGSEGIALDDGTTSTWIQVSNLFKQTFLNLPDGSMINGKISPAVAGNNLTLSLLTTSGGTPSASDPVLIKINGSWRTVTGATIVTTAAATNWAGLGSAAFATLEVDLFAYAVWNTAPATDAIYITWSRWPGGSVYSEFSGTSTNEKYLAYNTSGTQPNTTDDCIVIGRFAATLSAGAGYTWTVPTYTTVNLVQLPVYETRLLTWTPDWTLSATTTYTSVTTTFSKYKLTRDRCHVSLRATGTLGGSASTTLYCSVPFEAAQNAVNPAAGAGFAAGVYGGLFVTAGTPDKLSFVKYDVSNFATSGACVLNMTGVYEI